ncbi:MAG: AAA family ATPase [Methyloprofundus sp.]|nr:AAA family ATPase [Methyloprofundus sp.]
MLKKVKIKNFLSCTDVELGLDAVTALIGRNAAGKTNILRVIEERAQFAVGANKSIAGWEGIQGRLEKDSSEYSLEFSIESELFKYEVSISRSNKGRIIIENLWKYIDNNWKLITEREGKTAVFYHADEIIELNISASASVIYTLHSLLPEEKLSDISPVFNYLSKVTYYDLDNNLIKEFSSISENQYQQWLADNKKIERSVCMRLLHQWHSNKEQFEEIKALLGENGLNLIKDIVIKTVLWGEEEIDDNLFHRISFTAVTRNNILDYEDLSFGTRRVIAIILALLYDNNSTLLIEQPEDGIHVGLLRKVLSLCFTYAEHLNKQLVITTHSAEVIDLLEAKMIRFVKMTEAGTKASSLDDKTLSLVPRYIANEGTLSEFLETEDDE